MRLNIGCGPVVAQGWTNVDVSDMWEPFGAERGDPLEGLRWDDDAFDGAVAHHVLQMIAWPDLVAWLSEVRRVLKPGAVLRATVPDMLGAIRAAHHNQPEWFPVAGQTIDERLCVYLTQNGATRSVFTGPALTLLLERAGFVDASWRAETAPWRGGAVRTIGPEWLTVLDSRLDESLIVEGVKP